MRIAVVDGQGGGIGKAIVEKLRAELGSSVEIIALGTNVLATSAMLKGGADEGATGENAIVFNSDKVQIIVGAIGIVAANSMLGELTPAMAMSIAESPAKKVLIPTDRCNIKMTGVRSATLPQHIDDAVSLVRECL